MTLTTARITWGINKGNTKVTLRGGCTDEIMLIYKKREDALALLKALRKRER